MFAETGTTAVTAGNKGKSAEKLFVKTSAVEKIAKKKTTAVQKVAKAGILP